MRWTPYLLVALLVGACVPEPPGPEGPYGKPCTNDAACGALRCLADLGGEIEDLAPLPLQCDEEVVSGLHIPGCNGCPHGICLLTRSCASPCERDSDCANGERCVAAFAYVDDEQEKLASLDACVAISDLGEDVQVDSRIVRDAARDGGFEIELDGFDRNAPTLAVIEHLDPEWPGVECRPPLCLRSLRTRSAEPVTLFDAAADYRSEPPPMLPFASGDQISPLVLPLPGNRVPELSAGGYLAELESEHAGDLRVTRISADGSGRRFDVNVFYVGKLAIDPGRSAGYPLQTALDRVDEILGQAEISIGEINHFVIRGALPMRGTYFTDGSDPGAGFAMLQVRYGAYVELPGLFQLSAGAGNRAINLFLLADIEPLKAGQETEAQAGGIPGPPGMHGTTGSGIAVSANMMLAAPDVFGRTLAHEIAHYLGLFHTSESDGSVIENLPDTPECRSEQDLDRNGLTREECAEHGADNLMFWAKSDGVELSIKQGEQLRGSPLLY